MAFRLYLIRHAIAAEQGTAYPDDAQRPLTRQGLQRFRRIVAGLVALDVEIGEILTSPLVRARQTADLLASGLPGAPPVTETPVLLPGGAVNAVIAELAKYSHRRGLALVGHDPALGSIAARLIGARAPLEFKKGGVCLVEVPVLPPTKPGRLVWFAPPRLMRRLGGR